MALTLVGVDVGEGFADNTLTFSNVTATSGNLLVAVMGVNNATLNPVAATCKSGGVSWSLAVSPGSGAAMTSGIWYKISDGTETNAVFDLNDGNNQVAVFEFSGNATSSVLDASNYDATNRNSADQTASSGSATATADGLAFVVGAWRDARFALAGTHSFGTASIIQETTPTTNNRPIVVCGTWSYTGTGSKSDTDTTTGTGDENIGMIALFKAAAGGGATGTGALTTTATTASGSGVLTHTGTGAATTGNVTASGAGTLGHTGTGALTTLVSTLSGAGVLTHVGTGSLATTATTLSGTGTVTAAGEITGTGALTTNAVTASGSGVLSHTGTGSLSTSVVTLDGAGVLTHTGTGALTASAATVDGTGTVLGTITGTGALTTNKVTLSGYDVLPVSETPAGGGKGSTSKPAKRQKLIIVEQIDDVEELVEQVQEIIKTEPRKKLAKKVKKPAVSLQESPQAAFDWIGYYQAQLDALRDQQRAESLKQQLARNAQIIQAILENQANNAILSAQESEYARLREEEDFLLLLMAA